MKINILSISTSKRIDPTIEFYERYGWQVDRFNNDNRFPSYGRNAILESFYDSTDEWCCICDDDITIRDDKNEAAEFMSNTESILSKLPNCVGTFAGFNGNLYPTNRYQQSDKHKQHWVFMRDWNLGKIIFVRNTGKRYFQRTDLDYSEDHEFMYQQLKDGLWTGRCENIVIAERGRTQLFLAHNTKQQDLDRVDAKDRTQDKIVELYPNIIKWKNNKIDRTNLFRLADPQLRITLPFTHKHTIYNNLFQEA